MAVDNQVVVIDKEKVQRFLKRKPALVTLINEAAVQLGNFIPDARLRLELLADPDQGEEEQLLLGISSNFHDEEALKRLQQFDQGWWIANVRQAKGHLCIDLVDG